MTDKDKKGLTTRADVLAKIRAAKPKVALAGSRAAPLAKPEAKRPRLVFAFDATASRSAAWDSARKITDGIFTALPGELDVALAVHGGSTVHTFTEFSSDVGAFRDKAASISCQGGATQLCEVMERTLQSSGVKVLTYIGDCFEESVETALALADRFKARGIKAIMFHDAHGSDSSEQAREVFAEIARRTGGALLDFRADQQQQMGDLLAAVAALAVGGRKMLEARRASMPGAAKLLEKLEEPPLPFPGRGSAALGFSLARNLA